MKNILIAEDEPIARKALFGTLQRAGYEVIQAANGTEAWQILNSPEAPALAILDWMMPGFEGPQLCKALRNRENSQATYLILLTSKGDRADIVAGLEAGADDYITKPFDNQELHARIRVGFRVLELQEGLASRVLELEQAIQQIRHLQGLLPICSYCKKVRDDGNYWRQVEEYISENSDLKFSHGICPNCYKNEMEPQLTAIRLNKKVEG